MDSVECAISDVRADAEDLECVRVVTVVADKVERETIIVVEEEDKKKKKM